MELLSGILENDAKFWLAIMVEILPQEDIASGDHIVGYMVCTIEGDP
jgi:hypothetical protein